MRSRNFLGLISLLLIFSSACAATSAPLSTSTPGASSPSPHTIPTTTPGSPIPPTTTSNTAVVWKRSGGIAGMCQVLTIDFNGNYLLEDCKGDTPPISGELTPDQMSQLDDYLNNYGTFQWESTPPKNSADMFNDQLIFNGQGSVTPSPDEQQALNQFMASLASDLMNPATPSAPATSLGESGIQGQVTIGPACPGPVQTDNPCPDRPFQATITVLDQENKVVTQVECDAQGIFRIVLPPGTYTLRASPTTGHPHSGDQTVTVVQGQFAQVNIAYDSGLR